MCKYCKDTGTVDVPDAYVADEPPQYHLDPCPFCELGETEVAAEVAEPEEDATTSDYAHDYAQRLKRQQRRWAEASAREYADPLFRELVKSYMAEGAHRCYAEWRAADVVARERGIQTAAEGDRGA